MNSELKIGNVLWLYLQPSVNEPFMSIKHPYLIVKITACNVQVLQLDTFDKGRNWRAAKKESVILFKDNPPENVINKDCFAHLEKLITIENFNELVNYRKTDKTLSEEKLVRLKFKQEMYNLKNYVIKEGYVLSYKKEEILKHNPMDRKVN